MPTPLVTLAEYKAYKKLTKTDNDTELNFLINSVSALVKTYVGHTFIDYFSTPKVEVFNTTSSINVLQLKEWPIVNITSVESRLTYEDGYVVVDPADYFVDTYTDSIYKNSSFWPSGFGAVKVTYTAGYAATPDDIKLATLDLINHYFKEEYKERKSIGSSSIDNSTTRSAAVQTEWPIHISRVLDFYRNV